MAIDMQALRACVFQKTIAVICSKRKTTPFATVVMLFNQLSPILKTQNSELIYFLVQPDLPYIK